MGCDIHTFVEVRREGRWQHEPFHPFSGRNYGVFGWLAGVRNYSQVGPLAEPKGLPGDVSFRLRAESDDWDLNGHSHSWFTLAELLAVDYEAVIEDRRVARQTSANCFDGGCTAEPGGGETMPLRDFLGPDFMRDLEMLKHYGAPEAVRVVFWFDD